MTGPLSATPATPDHPLYAEYPNAWTDPKMKSDDRRTAKLRAAIEKAGAGRFWFAPDRVVLITPLFWIVRNGYGAPVLWYLVDDRVVMRRVEDLPEHDAQRFAGLIVEATKAGLLPG